MGFGRERTKFDFSRAVSSGPLEGITESLIHDMLPLLSTQ